MRFQLSLLRKKMKFWLRNLFAAGFLRKWLEPLHFSVINQRKKGGNWTLITQSTSTETGFIKTMSHKATATGDDTPKVAFEIGSSKLSWSHFKATVILAGKCSSTKSCWKRFCDCLRWSLVRLSNDKKPKYKCKQRFWSRLTQLMTAGFPEPSLVLRTDVVEDLGFVYISRGAGVLIHNAKVRWTPCQ